jgi:hypothetical protein
MKMADESRGKTSPIGLAGLSDWDQRPSAQTDSGIEMRILEIVPTNAMAPAHITNLTTFTWRSVHLTFRVSGVRVRLNPLSYAKVAIFGLFPLVPYKR